MSWKVYNDVIKVDAVWTVADERFRMQNVGMLVAAVGLPALLWWLTSDFTGAWMTIVCGIAAVVAAAWVILFTARMNRLSKMSTIDQWLMLRREAKNSVTNNYDHYYTDTDEG